MTLLNTQMFKPSTHKPNLTFCGSKANEEWHLSKYFHALLCVGWVITPGFHVFFTCQDIYSTVFCKIYNLCNLRIIEKYCNTLATAHFFRWASSFAGIYLWPLQCKHYGKCNVSWWNNMHSLGHIHIFSTLIPIFFINFFE